MRNAILSDDSNMPAAPDLDKYNGGLAVVALEGSDHLLWRGLLAARLKGLPPRYPTTSNGPAPRSQQLRGRRRKPIR